MIIILKIRDFIFKRSGLFWAILLIVFVDDILEYFGVEEVIADTSKFVVILMIVVIPIVKSKLDRNKYKDKIRVFRPTYSYRQIKRENLFLLIPFLLFSSVWIIATIIGEESFFGYAFACFIMALLFGLLIAIKGLSEVKEGNLVEIILTELKIVIFTDRGKNELAYDGLLFDAIDDDILRLSNRKEKKKEGDVNVNIEYLKNQEKNDLLEMLSKLTGK